MAMETKRKSFFICDILNENFSAFRHRGAGALGYAANMNAYTMMKAYTGYHANPGEYIPIYCIFLYKNK